MDWRLTIGNDVDETNLFAVADVYTSASGQLLPGIGSIITSSCQRSHVGRQLSIYRVTLSVSIDLPSRFTQCDHKLRVVAVRSCVHH